MNNRLDDQYWSTRYRQNLTGWDIGYVSDPIKQYLDQIVSKDYNILIPGAGNAYEAIYAFQTGFTNVHILDFAVEPLENFKKACPVFPISHIHQKDFFDFSGKFDLIIEQTFFCALHPDRRGEYARHCCDLLNPGGKVIGVLFDRNFESGPPFGGNVAEYRSVFREIFAEVSIEPCYNSIPQRNGAEVFIRLTKAQ
jgi:methyl halide transferase